MDLKCKKKINWSEIIYVSSRFAEQLQIVAILSPKSGADGIFGAYAALDRARGTSLSIGEVGSIVNGADGNNSVSNVPVWFGGIGIGIGVGAIIDVSSEICLCDAFGWPEIADASKLSRSGIDPITIGISMGVTPWQQLSIEPVTFWFFF